MPVYRGAGGAGDATNDATVTAVQAAATSAATSATNAANSATAAANSATGAATSATNASNSATTAAGQATTAAGHATNASTFATNSSLSADDAEDAATEAEGYASEAFDYKVAAASSASSASTSATNAGTSATNSAASAASALAIYGNTTAMNNAVASATASASAASTSASNASTSATTATNAATTATTQATNAAASAVAADADATSASTDANEAQAAATAAQAAVSSATAIYGSIEDIQQAEVNSEANRDAAAASATSASNSASAASTSATNSATSASAAATSAASASAVALGNEPVRHSVRPSLLLDFANTKTLDPRITYTRASTGTYYDGKTVAKAEENFVTFSEQFDNAAWAKTRSSITANSTTAPDGNTTADSIIEDTSNSTHFVRQSATVISGSTYIVSAFVKENTRSWCLLAINSGSGYYFNLSTGAVGSAFSATGTVSNPFVTSVGNGWYRCGFTIVTGNTTGGIDIYTATADNTASYAGNGTSGIFLWGAQLEQRSSVTAYTATTTAPITNYIPALQTAAAGVARFEHNPTTGESLGLEIEEQRTNLQTYSETFNNAVWNNILNLLAFGSGSTANIAISPDGTQTADLIVESTATGQHYLFGTVFSDATTKTFSLYVKAAGRTRMRLVIGASSANQGVYADVNLTAGTISNATLISGSFTAVGSSITNVGNGWYRCSVTATTPATAHTGYILIANASGDTNYTGDGYSGIYIWGAQIEAGSFATSYIPTVASQVTRSADSASMTGTNFSSWFRKDEGSFYTEFNQPNNVGTVKGLYAASVGIATSSGIYQDILGSSTRYYLDGGSTALLSTAIPSFVNSNKVINVYKVNDFATSTNGGTVGTDTSTAAIPAIDTLIIGGIATSFQLNGTIKKFAYYPKRLTNAELQGVTTV